MLPSGPMCKKAVICLAEKICVLDKFHSGMSYRVVYEVSVNESTIGYTQQKNEKLLRSACEAEIEGAKVTSKVAKSVGC